MTKVHPVFKMLAPIVALVMFMASAVASTPVDPTTSKTTISVAPPTWLTEYPDWAVLPPVEAQLEPSPQPLATSLFWASDHKTYSVASTVWEADFQGWKNVNAVALAGFRVSDSIPVWGGGLEWSGTTRIARGVNGYASLLIGGLWEQNQALDKVRGVFGLNLGIQVVRF